MLKNLTIKNYALIEHLNVSFNAGLSTITGETGAGKSLLLGALGLLLGNRADSSSAKDTTVKCVIEGAFDVASYNIVSLFEEEGLDYEEETIIRREILPSGKSRAFVNDTPVTLQSLKTLGVRLIDIHSQHQTLAVTKNDFQFTVLDALSKAQREILSYKRGVQQLRKQEKELQQLQHNQEEFSKEYAYNSFLLQELEDANLVSGELATLEEQYETLHNIEEIQERLSSAIGTVTIEEFGVIDQLHTVRNSLSKIASFSGVLSGLSDRVESVGIELDDIHGALQDALDRLEADPETLAKVNGRLQLLNDLQTKHAVGTVEELITITTVLQTKVSQTDALTGDIETLQTTISNTQEQLDTLALRIHEKREKALPKLIPALETILQTLGMPNATFKASLVLEETYFANGKDTLEFLFSANKGIAHGELKKVASGGELSRIMIAIKAILSQYTKLPTLIFDEIDTGVSGEVAQKMAALMEDMGKNLQVFSITHLPQIAAAGQTQYKVFKQDMDEVTRTQLKVLTAEERIQEIAEMIGGKDITDSAVLHATSLLQKT